MDRRKILKFGSAICFSGIVGFENIKAMENLYPNVSIPEFSSERLHSLLDTLVDAYESKGLRVSDTLLPPISQSDLEKQCSWFPGELSQEIVSLYSWRGGQAQEAWYEESPFWFRDNSFCSIDRAKREYRSMMESYGAYPEDHQLLKSSFPFAAFNGGFYVLPTKGQPFSPNIKSPVISVLQGIDIHYYSMELMVSTCIDWVSHDKYQADHTLPEDIEMEIWRKHNPGIFRHGA